MRCWPPFALVGLIALAIAGTLPIARPSLAHSLAAIGLEPAPRTRVGDQPGAPDRVLVVYVNSSGFMEDELVVSPGLRRVLIRNRSGFDGLSFTVTRPGKDALLVTTADSGWNAEGDVPFAPGDVLITETSRPEWQCRITVQP